MTNSLSQKSKAPLRSFFEGKLYPFIIASLVLTGYVTGYEFYLNIFIVAATCVSLIVCESIKPFLPTMLVIVFQINLQHTPGIPTWSDYYLKWYRLAIAIILILSLVASIAFYLIKNVFPKLSLKRTPMLIPTILFSIALVFNGAFSERWVIGSTIFGIGEAAVFFLLFYAIYYGIAKENTKKLLDHISYLSLLVAMVLVGELIYVYLFKEGVIVDGVIRKEELLFGWTVNNPFGFHLTVLIPPLMRGALKSKRFSLGYFFASIIVWAAAILTLSRNAWIFATLSLGICIIIACFAAERKRTFRVITLMTLMLGVCALVIYYDKLMEIFSRVIKIGFYYDSGRFNLWRQSFENFLASRIFGYGFFGFGESDVYVTVDFLPTMAHNTVFQLMSACGGVGLFSYALYRLVSLIPLFKRFNYEKLMLYMVVFITVGASLLDNFLFYFIDSVHYVLSLAIILKILF